MNRFQLVLSALGAGALLAAAGCARDAAGAGRSGTTGVPSALVAWESNRSGAFRIWIASLESDGADLEAGRPRQISPDDPERDHCCPALSPDGTRLLYASLRPQRGKYLPRETPVELRIVDLESGRGRTLSGTARLNGENRAALWWSASSLVYLEADESTRRLDLAAGTNETIVPASEGGGWLVAADGRHANRSEPTFSERDPATGAIRLATDLGGCQPAFTSTGELGLWTAGAGGPLDVLDLATRTSRSIVRRGDPRLPAGRRYLYFPAIAPDRTLLAWAASDGTHDHFRADYDLFVARLDPETLELAGPPFAIAPHPAVDRYPDLWRLAAPGATRRARAAPHTPKAPATPEGTPLWVWRGASDENRAAPSSDSEALELDGAAWYDRLGRLALGGGFATVRTASAARVDRGLRATNSLSAALLVELSSLASDRIVPLITLARGGRQRGFSIRQRGAVIELLLRTGPSGPSRPAREAIELATLPDVAPHHVAFRFSPGRLASFLDGKPQRTEVVPGDFFHWKNDDLRLGDEIASDARFRGALGDLAIWDRELSNAEVAAEAARALDRLRAAPRVERLRVRARLVARSTPPTLEEISPYRTALVVEEYELVDALRGGEGATKTPAPPPRFRVARWALLNGETAAQARTPIGATVELLLERFDAQPQLESLVLADTLPPAPGLPLYANVGVE